MKFSRPHTSALLKSGRIIWSALELSTRVFNSGLNATTITAWQFTGNPSPETKLKSAKSPLKNSVFMFNCIHITNLVYRFLQEREKG